jgi:hypothetical protein
MIDGSLVAQITFDMTQKHTDGLWIVIFTKRATLSFTWLTCVFGGLSIFVTLY